ncbi:MAG TPA: substrate-binding domain-containing protein [Kofleriaceae bacterium]|jgi:ABC-type xylose transport system substrate-binding protein
MRALATMIALVAAACTTEPAKPEVAILLSHAASDLPPLALAAEHATVIRVAVTAEEQRSQLAAALASGVRIVVLDPVDNAAGMTASAHDAGARVIAYGRAVEDADAVVMFDGYRAGVLQAQATLASLAGRRGIALVTDNDPLAIEISRGVENTLAPYFSSGAVTRAEPEAASALICSSEVAHTITSGFPARRELATATQRLIERILAGEDLDRDPTLPRLPGHRMAVELADVRPFTPKDCQSPPVVAL